MLRGQRNSLSVTQTPKNHHFLPRSYLDGFAVRGQLWVANAKKRKIRASIPRNVASRRHYYSYVLEDGTKDPALETKLLQKIDSDGIACIRMLSAGHWLSTKQERTFALYVALLAVRTPTFETQRARHLKVVIEQAARNAPELVKALEVARLEEPNVKWKDTVAEQVAAEVEGGAVDDFLHRNSSLESLVQVAPGIAELLLSMEWIVVHAGSSDSFVTCDQPFVTSPLDGFVESEWGRRLDSPNLLKIVPLSGKTCLLAAEKGRRRSHVPAQPGLIRALNREIACHADELLIGGSRTNVERLASAVGML